MLRIEQAASNDTPAIDKFIRSRIGPACRFCGHKLQELPVNVDVYPDLAKSRVTYAPLPGRGRT